MRKKRDPETEEERNRRIERQARTRSDEVAMEDQVLDAAVRRSIDLHGA